MTDFRAETWKLDFHSGVPVYRQIMNQVQAAIGSGALRSGDQLPTIRELHQKLGVNPNTIARAYRELALAGAIESEQGSGCFVKAHHQRAQPNARERRLLLDELCARFTAEARSQGIGVDELLTHLSTTTQSSRT